MVIMIKFNFISSHFLRGMGSILNIAGPPISETCKDSSLDADIKAIESDWAMIGKDIRDSIRGFENEIKERTSNNQV